MSSPEAPARMASRICCIGGNYLSLRACPKSTRGTLVAMEHPDFRARLEQQAATIIGRARAEAAEIVRAADARAEEIEADAERRAAAAMGDVEGLRHQAHLELVKA